MHSFSPPSARQKFKCHLCFKVGVSRFNHTAQHWKLWFPPVHRNFVCVCVLLETEVRMNVGERKNCGNCAFKWKWGEKDLSSGRHGPLVIYINGAVPLMSCQGQGGKVRNKQCLKTHQFHSERVFCFVFWADESSLCEKGMNQNQINRVQSFQLTLGSVISIPIRNINSAMKRLMHRFLWMVLRSLCRPRKKQKVKMLMLRQTRDTTMPTRVMTVRSSSWTLPLTFEG